MSIMLLSCSIDDNTNDFYLETLPIESVDMPDSFVSGETAVIKGLKNMREHHCILIRYRFSYLKHLHLFIQIVR